MDAYSAILIELKDVIYVYFSSVYPLSVISIQIVVNIWFLVKDSHKLLYNN